MRFILSAITLVLANVAFAADSAVEVKTMPLSNFDEYMIFKYEGHPASINHSYMIDLAEPASLQVVDFEDAGEQYFIYDNGGLLGVTSNVHLDSNAFAESPQTFQRNSQNYIPSRDPICFGFCCSSTVEEGTQTMETRWQRHRRR
jgi:hypothetical protein